MNKFFVIILLSAVCAGCAKNWEDHYDYYTPSGQEIPQLNTQEFVHYIDSMYHGQPSIVYAMDACCPGCRLRIDSVMIYTQKYNLPLIFLIMERSTDSVLVTELVEYAALKYSNDLDIVILSDSLYDVKYRNKRPASKYPWSDHVIAKAPYEWNKIRNFYTQLGDTGQCGVPRIFLFENGGYSRTLKTLK